MVYIYHLLFIFITLWFLYIKYKIVGRKKWRRREKRKKKTSKIKRIFMVIIVITIIIIIMIVVLNALIVIIIITTVFNMLLSFLYSISILTTTISKFIIAQIAGAEVYRQKIVDQNAFLHSLSIIPIYIIDTDKQSKIRIIELLF